MKHIYFLFLLCCSASLVAVGQGLSPVLVSSAGGYDIGTTAILEWSLGEAAIATLNSPSSILTEGFHQPHLRILGIEQITPESYRIAVFPNPTRSQVNVRFERTPDEDQVVAIFNMQGMEMLRVQRDKAAQDILIDLASFAPAAYAMHIFDSAGKPVHALKILKIH